MDTDNQRPRRTYTLKPITTPLPSHAEKRAEQPHHDAQPVRDINEDDDGYDPYSDYVAPSHLFEKDPWR